MSKHQLISNLTREDLQALFIETMLKSSLSSLTKKKNHETRIIKQKLGRSQYRNELFNSLLRSFISKEIIVSIQRRRQYCPNCLQVNCIAKQSDQSYKRKGQKQQRPNLYANFILGLGFQLRKIHSTFVKLEGNELDSTQNR